MWEKVVVVVGENNPTQLGSPQGPGTLDTPQNARGDAAGDQIPSCLPSTSFSTWTNPGAQRRARMGQRGMDALDFVETLAGGRYYKLVATQALSETREPSIDHPYSPCY